MDISANMHLDKAKLLAEARSLGGGAIVTLKSVDDPDSYPSVTLFIADLVYATTLAEAINQVRLDYEQNRKEDEMEEVS